MKNKIFLPNSFFLGLTTSWVASLLSIRCHICYVRENSRHRNDSSKYFIGNFKE